MEIFKKEYIGLFSPYSGVELIDTILQNIGQHKDFTTKEARRAGLKAINKLFELGLIEVFHWGNYVHQLKGENLSIYEKMMYIQEMWFFGADFSDFTDMPMFKYKDWYIKELERKGMTHNTDWKKFVVNEIGDLEKWIKENKPNDK